MLQIDGSLGEGGGQILRSSLTMSLVTGKGFNLKNIRANRKKPGLLRQHLTAVKAAEAISNAKTKGVTLGSKEIRFEPDSINPGYYIFDVGSAGSANLVIQTLLPALLTADQPSRFLVKGGTHNPFAPPYDFLVDTYFATLSRMGVQIESHLESYGFYPAGGGSYSLHIIPTPKLIPLNILHRGDIKSINTFAIVSNLPLKIAEGEVEIIKKNLPINYNKFFEVESPGPGNIVMVKVESQNITEVISTFGQKGIFHELVAQQAVQTTNRYLNSTAPLGSFLADQILIPLVLAGGGSFRTLPPTLHTITNIELIKKFINIDIKIAEMGENIYEIILKVIN